MMKHNIIDPPRWYKCTKCGIEMLNEDDIEVDYGVFLGQSGPQFMRIYIHKGKCKGRVVEYDPFKMRRLC